jgi:hypothetical protein
MSSGVGEVLGVGSEGSVDDVGESAFERPEGLGGGIAAGDASIAERLGVGVVSELGDGDAVDGGVELAVACARETVSVPVAGLGRVL